MLQHRAGDAEGEGEDLFAFLVKKTTSPATGTNSILGEVDRYLTNPDITTQSFLKYPCVAEAFMKHNSALPVEHLFSCML